MLKGLKSKNPDKDYPSKLGGQKWTEKEETLLLEELSKNIDIQLIAQCHNRTTGGIDARRREIAYKMYINDISMEDIIRKTKLDEHYINETIQRRQNKQNNAKNNATKCKSITEITTPFSIKSEIDEMKKDITDIKNTIKELVEMMKAVYEFEDA